MHDHACCDHHKPASYNAAFAVGVCLNAAFIGVEVIYGVASHSLSLLADAGHNLGDALSLLLGWAAAVLATRPPTLRHTYGYRRSSILAALANAVLLLLAVGAVAWEAARRLAEPVQVQGNVVMAVAGLGILVNGGVALMFVRGKANDLNIESAYMHMLTDAAVSAAVVVAGLLIRFTGYAWLDSGLALLVSLLIAVSSWRLLRRSVDLALDAVPENVNLLDVRQFLEGLPGVAAVTDLHVWAMSTTQNALTAHLVVPGGAEDGFVGDVAHQLRHDFGILHTTLQLDRVVSAGGCALVDSH